MAIVMEKNDEEQKLMRVWLDIAEQLLNAGAEISRVVKTPSMDVSRIERLNALSREASEEKLTAGELKKRLDGITAEESSRTTILGGVIAAAAFSFFFGGSPWDALVSGGFGFFICLFARKAGRYFSNPVFYNFVVSLAVGTMIYLMGRLFPGLQMDKVIIGDIMLLVPGLTITIAMRDMLAGDTISGLLRFVESIIWTGGLAAGFLASMLITGGAL